MVLPDGASAVEALNADAHTLEFLRAKYWRCKPILAFSASQALLAEAQIRMALSDSPVVAGRILADAADVDAAISDFVAAIGSPQQIGRENYPPKV